MQSSYGRPFPSTAHYLVLIGAIFMAIEAIIDIVEAAALSASLESILPGLTGLVIVVGVIGLVFALVMIYLSTRLRSDPSSARSTGIIVIVLSVVSLVFDSGFFIGFLLALIGGILAYTWKPPVAPQSAYGANPYAPGAAMPSGQWGAPPAPPTPPGVAQRFCSSCGSPNVANAQFCAKCGAPMS